MARGDYLGTYAGLPAFEAKNPVHPKCCFYLEHRDALTMLEHPEFAQANEIWVAPHALDLFKEALAGDVELSPLHTNCSHLVSFVANGVLRDCQPFFRRPRTIRPPMPLKTGPMAFRIVKSPVGLVQVPTSFVGDYHDGILPYGPFSPF